LQEGRTHKKGEEKHGSLDEKESQKGGKFSMKRKEHDARKDGKKGGTIRATARRGGSRGEVRKGNRKDSVIHAK